MIQGHWFQEGRAQRVSATLAISEGQYQLLTDEQVQLTGTIDSIQVSDRLADVERKLILPDGSVFATRDNDAVDLAFRTTRAANGLLHRLESSMGWVLVALLVTIGSSVAFFKWGIPAISAGVAYVLPQRANELIAASTLDFLDDFLFDPSKTDIATRKRIEAHFQSRLIDLDDRNGSIAYKLHFRAWTEGGKPVPNALALPSGDIILTDEFIRLSENQDQMDSVILHEMGHIVHRHSLKRVIEASLVTTVVMMVTGDNNGLADMGIGLGSLILGSHYSRQYEAEADQYAFNHMLKAEIDPQSFALIMERMRTSMNRHRDGDVHEESSAGRVPEENPNQQDRVLDYLSTHPRTDDRINEAQRYSECFRQGLKTCEPGKVR